MGQFGSLASLYSQKILFLDSINSEFINFLYWEFQTHAIPKYLYWLRTMKVPTLLVSSLCQVEVVSRVMDELSLDHSDQGDFDVNNPKTWSKESVAHIETTLDVNEVTKVTMSI